MPYNPTDFYGSLRVQPDTRVIYEGLANMGQGLANGINSLTNTFVENKREDKRMAHAESMADKQIAAGTAARKDSQAFEEMMFGKREAASNTRRSEDRALAKEESKLFGDNKLAAAFHFAETIAPGSFSPDTIEVLKGIEDPKVKAAFADQVINFSAEKMRTAQDQEQASERRKLYPMTNPTTGEPLTNYGITGAGSVVPYPQPEPTMEEIAAGIKAQQDLIQSLGGGGTIKTPQGTITIPKPGQAKAEADYATDADGKIVKVPAGFEIPESYKPLPRKQTTPDGKPLRTTGTKIF